jgi:hypothetical protein
VPLRPQRDERTPPEPASINVKPSIHLYWTVEPNDVLTVEALLVSWMEPQRGTGGHWSTATRHMKH